jgi:uncharacterized protein DUF4276
MVRVLALVEGPTERNFGQRVLAPHLGYLNVEFHPRVIGKPGHKGGVGHWDRAKREIMALIRQEPTSVFTTMFDLNGLPMSWPGRTDARKNGLKNRNAAGFIEQRIGEAIESEFSGSSVQLQFIPYLSLREYEALLFSSPETIADVTQDPSHVDEYQAILDECGECEKINDHPETAPSKRLLKIARGYDKTTDGIAIAERIGLKTIREKCPHFDAWLRELESLGGTAG